MRPPRPKFLPFDRAREIIHAYNFKNLRTWRAWCAAGKRPKNIPSAPNHYYKNSGWCDFPDWLGYRKRAAVTRGHDTGEASIRSSNSILPAKELFLSHAANLPYQFDLLPHRALAHVAYRTEEDAQQDLWCPLVLRSMTHQYTERSHLYVRPPGCRVGRGVLFILVAEKRFFFFPFDFLDSCFQHKNAWALHRVPMERAREYEVFDNAALHDCLEKHYSCATLLHETELPSTLFSGHVDVLLNTLVQQAVAFFRTVCRLTLKRPTSVTSDAHYETAGGKTLVFRCNSLPTARAFRNGRKVALGLPRELNSSRDGFSSCAAERCPDYIVTLWRDEEEQAFDDDGAAARVPFAAEKARLRALFIFPRRFLQEKGRLSELDNEKQSGRQSLYVYPPWTTPVRSDSRQRKLEQEQFCIDLSPEADKAASVAKVHKILESEDFPENSHGERPSSLLVAA
ncbi:unnamed protein product [Amoebophrya sp. A120]|nr:unnamed protein product [Amoebophrya sp. A120]|eukprot:GSA120T00004548001.1